MSGASASLLRHMNQLVESQRFAQLSDRQLLQRFASERDEEAFASVLRRHGPMVLGVCRRLLGHEQDAEDAFQAVFLILARKARSIRQSDASGWLYRTAYHLAIRARGIAGKRVGAASRAALPSPARLAGPTGTGRTADPLSEVSWREVRSVVDEELQRLPETLRSPLVLCYLEGQSQPEAARLLGWSKITLRRRLERGRERLRLRLRARGLAPAAAAAALCCESMATAMVSATLRKATIRAVLGDAISPAVAALTKSALPILYIGKIKLTAALLLAVAAGSALMIAHPVASGTDKNPSASPPPRAKEKTIVLHGRVLAPDGRPKAGAKLLLLDAKGRTANLGTAAEDGRFRVAVPVGPNGRLLFSHLIAQADGCGIDFLDAMQYQSGKAIELRLVNDHAIRGRIVNTEGKPVAGVRVAVKYLGVYANNSLDSFLALWKARQNINSGLPNGEKGIENEASTLLATKTDSDGRFTISQVGAERLVELRLSGAGIADAEVWIVNRRGFDPKPYNDAVVNNSVPSAIRDFGLTWRLYGPELSVVAEAGKPIRGIVKDVETGKGRPGVRVRITRKEGSRLLWTMPEATTDAQGRYIIAGARKAKRYMLEIARDPVAGYMPCQIWTDDTPGYDPITVDIGVKKGVIVTGKVIDRATGKPVPGWAIIDALADNRFVKTYPAFDNSAWAQNGESTAESGVFRVVTVPGLVVLMGGRGPDSGYKPGGNIETMQYKQAVPDAKYPQYFHKRPDLTTYQGYRNSFLSGNFCKVLQIEPGTVVVKQDIVLERASAVAVNLRDEANRPLSGVWMTGITRENWRRPVRIDGDSCSVYDVEADKPRRLIFYHPDKKRIGTCMVRGDEKKPVLVKLGPAGAIRGRLLDADGKPLAGAVIDVRYRDREAEEINRIIHEAKQIVTDAAGAFTIHELIPGLRFELSFRHGRQHFERQAKAGEALIQVKAGERRDVGEIRLKRRP